MYSWMLMISTIWWHLCYYSNTHLDKYSTTATTADKTLVNLQQSMRQINSSDRFPSYFNAWGWADKFRQLHVSWQRYFIPVLSISCIEHDRCGTISCRVRAAIVVDPLIEDRSINRMFDSSTWCCIAPMTCCPTIERSSVTATSCKLIDFRSRFDPQLLHVWWNMITYTMSHDGWFGKFSTSTVEWSWVNKNIYAMELVPTWFSQCINSMC